MEKKNVLRPLLCYLLMGLFLVGGATISYGGEPGLGGHSGSQPSFLPVSGAQEPEETSEAQALRDGYELIRFDKKALGHTGKPGLEGATGGNPSLFPAPIEGEGAIASSSEDWALVVGENSPAKAGAALGNAGKPGLGGKSGSQPRLIPAAQKGGATTSTK